MSSATTEDLARQASRGDEGALETIYRDYHQPLYRFCLAIVGNPQDAQDALQNTMVKMLRALPGEERAIALRPWLYRIAHNESIDLLRKRRPNVSLEASEPQLGEELAVQVEMRQRLRRLIADLGALPGRQRETLLMREAGGMSFEEIGAALETSPAVARQTLYEARLGLRQMKTGREMKCEAITKALSDGDGRVRRRRDIQAHLRDCGHCRRFAEEIDSRGDALAAISPLPAIAAAAMLQGLIGGGSAGGVAGAGGAIGGVAGKSIGTATLLKGAATVAVVAAVGIGAADRTGLIHPGGDAGSRAPTKTGAASATPATGGAAGSSPARSSGEPRVSSLGKATSARDGSAARALDHAQAAPGAAPGADPAGGEHAPAEPASTETGAPASRGASRAEHPHGRGHAKQTPTAAAHGQETAASHKSEKSQGPSASKPSAGKSESAKQPAQPAAPAAPAPTSPPPATEPEAKSPPGKPAE